ncbi:MAG: thioesterase family protein [Acidimicrobiales bacterium]
MSSDITRFPEFFEMAAHGPDVWVGASARYPWGRVYGGQVAAQGLWAAAQTVPEGYMPHSLHTYFIRGGESDEPIRFEVDRIRDGRSFVTRRVVARQSSGAILNLSASFHIHEDAPDVTAVVMPSPVEQPEDLPEAGWSRLLERRMVPFDQQRSRGWLRVPDVGDDPLMHVLAHAFASDDLPTDAVEIEHPVGRVHPEPGFEQDYPYMGASLDHTIWFHRPARADEWCLHDLRSSGVYGSRGIAFGEIWSRDGVHVATIAQEVLLREATPKG